MQCPASLTIPSLEVKGSFAKRLGYSKMKGDIHKYLRELVI